MASGKPPVNHRARCYVELLGDTVVTRHAVGPDPQGDGTEAYPDVPADWVPVSFDVYQDVRVGMRQDGDAFVAGDDDSTAPLPDRLARLEARMRVLERAARVSEPAPEPVDVAPKKRSTRKKV